MPLTNDSLQFIAPNKIQTYIEIYKEYLPKTVDPYNFLIDRVRTGNLILFIPRDGNVENGTIFAIPSKGLITKERMVYVFSMDATGEEIDRSLRNTRRINWSTELTFYVNNRNYFNIFEKYIKEQHKELAWFSDINTMALTKEKALQFKYNIPADVYVAPLAIEHAEIIDSFWTFKSQISLKYIKTLIYLNGGLGVFDKISNRLFCWALITEFSGIGILHTLEPYRNKGFAKLLVKILCKQIVEQHDVDPQTFVVINNYRSKNLFSSLGFTVCCKSCSFRLKKIS